VLVCFASSLALGVLLDVYVHFGLEEDAAGIVVADTLGALRYKIKEVFSDETRKFLDAHMLIVQTKDAENKLHPLKNDAELELDGVLKPDTTGTYRVYVTVPKVEATGTLAKATCQLIFLTQELCSDIFVRFLKRLCVMNFFTANSIYSSSSRAKFTCPWTQLSSWDGTAFRASQSLRKIYN